MIQITLVIDTDTVDPKLRKAVLPRLERALQRFDEQLLHVRAVLRDEHGRHGAPCYRCRFEVDLVSGGHQVCSGEHLHPQGAVTEATRVLRRLLASRAEGVQARDRRHGRSGRIRPRAA